LRPRRAAELREGRPGTLLQKDFDLAAQLLIAKACFG
jgi:hypothetical protein